MQLRAKKLILQTLPSFCVRHARIVARTLGETADAMWMAVHSVAASLSSSPPLCTSKKSAAAVSSTSLNSIMRGSECGGLASAPAARTVESELLEAGCVSSSGTATW